MSWRKRLDDPHNLNLSDLKRGVIVCVLALIGLLVVAVATGHCDDRHDGTRFRLTATAYAGLAAVDAVQTAHGLAIGGREANPVMQPVASAPAKLALVKGASAAGIIGVAAALHRQHPKAAWTFLWSMTALQGAVVVWNARQLSKAGR